MSKARAVDYIKSFELPPDEENVLLKCDVQKMTSVQAMFALHMSISQIKRAHSRAYARIADKQDYEQEKAGA